VFFLPLIETLDQKIDQQDLLRLHLNLFDTGLDIRQPALDLSDGSLDSGDQGVGLLDLAVQVSDIGLDMPLHSMVVTAGPMWTVGIWSMSCLS